MPRDPATAESDAPRRRRWGMRLAGGVSFCILATSCVGWGVLHGIGDSISRVDAFHGVHDRPADDSALTFLVVGTDDRDGVPPDELKRVLHAGGPSCHCTDTMMLVHLSKDRGRATVVSIPRDSYVGIPAHTDPTTGKAVPLTKGKINAAYGMGGPSLTIQTVEQATGIRIDHYLQVNFLTFVSTVDALGGVEVCSDTPLHDSYSGLDLPAGTTRLDGTGALKYVRARHVDGSADLGRMQRQQRFVAQVLHQATSGDTLLNPVKLDAVTGAVLKSLKADKGLSTKDLIDLATRLRGLSPANADFATVPAAEVSHYVPGWGSTVLWDEPKAKALFAALRTDRPLTADAAAAPAPSAGRPGGRSQDSAAAAGALTVPPQRIRVQVLNGTAVAGLGARADTDLRALGFATTGLPLNAAGIGATRTVIRYDPRWDESVKTVAAALPQARLTKVPGLGPTLQVVTGSDYTRPLPPSVFAAPSASPSPTVSASPGDKVICR